MSLITWNPNDKGANIALSDNNLTVTSGSSSWQAVRATEGKIGGKWYWETTLVDIVAGTTNKRNLSGISVAEMPLNDYVGGNAYSIGVQPSNALRVYYNNSLRESLGSSVATGVIGIALDLDDNKIFLYHNGTLLGQFNDQPSLLGDLDSKEIFAAESVCIAGAKVTANFGATEFDIITSNSTAWEALIASGYLPYDIENAGWFYKPFFLFKDDDDLIKTWNPITSNWDILLDEDEDPISENDLTDEVYQEHGMTSLVGLNSTTLTLLGDSPELLCWTDNDEVVPVLRLIGVPPYRPIDLLDSQQPELIAWIENAEEQDTVKARLTVPEYRLIDILESKEPELLFWTNSENDPETVLNITTQQYEPRFLVSKDNKTTWYTFKDESWASADLSNFLEDGMTKSEIESIEQTDWKNWMAGSTTFDFAILLQGFEAENSLYKPYVYNIEFEYPPDEAPLINNFELLPDSIHNEWVELTADIIDPEGHDWQYQVWINDTQDFPSTEGEWSDFIIGDGSIFKTYNHEWFNLGTNTVTLKIRDELGAERAQTGTVYLANANPLITVTFTAFEMHGTISDSDGDNIAYKIIINNEQVIPATEGFTDFVAPPIAFEYSWQNDNDIIKIGEQNTITIQAIDTFGGSDQVSYSFIGVLKGLFFKDKYNNMYTTANGELIKTLELGAIKAGEYSQVLPVYIENMLGTNLDNVTVSIDETDLAANSVVSLSKTEEPFQDRQEIQYPEALTHGDKKIFYIRVSASEDVVPGQSDFSIKVEGDSI